MAKNENKKECFFSTGIDGDTTCSREPNFDANGFPVVPCPDFPCNVYLNLKINIMNVKLGRLEDAKDTLKAMVKALVNDRTPCK